MRLNEIQDNRGARREKKRLGRGIGSGLGKTSGRGGKGQTARSGVAINGFEGGQTPIYRRLPKRGFKNIHAQDLFELTFEKLNVAVDAGLIKAGETVDRDVLVKIGFMKKWYDGISLVATGELKHKFTLEVTRSTKSALQQVEKLGGSVKLS
ncbi:50S ribosomal protein L15 [Candidatus Paracaedibacter symbiosus]|uniref:50S ribosomal protein L15 n=1 Tax=Candidatus Paracaedibacter symbiosus TaxID=244582 RepID=UPI0005099863|nr:50S ribosomal protein L15 [Candidatus Paracaedibacter symbiosus]